MRNITQLVKTPPVKRPQLESKLAKEGRDLTQSSKNWDDRNLDLVYECHFTGGRNGVAVEYI